MSLDMITLLFNVIQPCIRLSFRSHDMADNDATTIRRATVSDIKINKCKERTLCSTEHQHQLTYQIGDLNGIVSNCIYEAGNLYNKIQSWLKIQDQWFPTFIHHDPFLYSFI